MAQLAAPGPGNAGPRTMPASARLLLRPLPALDGHLAAALDGELAGGRRLGDGGSGADRRALADRDRGHQHRARPDERAIADRRAMLVHAVVVAGHRPGADIHLRAHGRVAHVAEVVGLAAGADLAVLHLDEVAEMHAVREPRAAADAGERADGAARAGNEAFEVA